MAAADGIEILRSEPEMAGLRREWGELHAVAKPGNPFLSFDWTIACKHHQCRESEPFIVTLREGGRLVALAPLRRDRQAGFRVLRFMGDGRSDYLGFLFRGDRPELEPKLLEALQQHRALWDLAVLRQLAAPYSTLDSISTPNGLESHGVAGTVAPHVRFDGDWSALLASGPGWLKRMAKAARKWVKDGGSVLRVSSGEAIRYLDQIAEIEAASWKGAEGVARFQPGPGQELLREVLGGLGASEQMELWLSWKDDCPVAFEINLLSPGKIWLYQGAYRTEYRKYSPGGVLDFLSIERAWQEGAREYDFMSGDEPYKAERTTAQRTINYLAIHPADARGRLAYELLIAPRWRLKGYAPAKAMHQTWSRWRSRGRRPALPQAPHLGPGENVTAGV